MTNQDSAVQMNRHEAKLAERTHVELVDTITALQCVLQSARPLTTAELLEALDVSHSVSESTDAALTTSPERLLSLCRGLLEVGEDDTLKFSDHAAKQWVSDQTTTKWATFAPVNERAAHVDLGTLCLRFLALQELQKQSLRTAKGFNQARADHPFFDYAVTYWRYHLPLCDSSVALPMVRKMIENELPRAICTRQLLESKGWSEGRQHDLRANGVHFVAMFGLTSHLTLTWDPNLKSALLSCDEFDRRPADYALLMQDAETCIWLIQASWTLRIPVHRLCNTSCFMTDAISQGWWDVVRLLIDSGFNVNDREMSSRYLPLQTAVRMHHTDIVTLLLDAGASIEEQDSAGFTAFTAAIECGHKPSWETLMSRGCNLHTRTNEGDNALAIAISKRRDPTLIRNLLAQGLSKLRQPPPSVDTGRESVLHDIACSANKDNVDLLQSLCEQELDINAAQGDGQTPLHLACRSSAHPEFIRKLLDLGADRTITCKKGLMPLHQASRDGCSLELMKLLVGGTHSPHYIDHLDDTGRTALHYAARSDRIDIVKLLLDHGASVDISHKANKNTTPLHDAVLHGLLPIVLELLRRGADPRRRGLRNATALHYAAIMGFADLIDPLIQHGADLNAVCDTNNSVLDFAVQKSATDFIARLLNDYGPVDLNVSTDIGWTPLHRASSSGDLEIVNLLLGKGAKMTPDRTGEYPIHQAAYKGHHRVVKALLDAGANPNVTNARGITPLMFAATWDNGEVMQVLLARPDTLIDCKDNLGDTPLSMSLGARKFDAAGLMLDRGADPHVVGSYGRTLLHSAVRAKSAAWVRKLIDLGLPRDPTDSFGETPLAKALEGGDEEIVRILEDTQSVDWTIVDNNGETHLGRAAVSGNLALVEKTLGKCPSTLHSLDSLERNALFNAARKGQLVVVRYLLEQGIKVDPKPSHKFHTTLSKTVCRRYPLVVKELLAHCDPSLVNFTDFYEVTNLMNAEPRCADLLLQAGADPRAVDGYGWSAWDYAALNEESLRTLASYHEPSESLDKDQRTKVLHRNILDSLWGMQLIGDRRDVQAIYFRLECVSRLRSCMILCKELADDPRLLQISAECTRDPEADAYKLERVCAVCRKKDYKGDDWECSDCPCSQMCSACHEDFEKAGRKLPSTAAEVSALERSVQPLSFVLGNLDTSRFVQMILAMRRHYPLTKWLIDKRNAYQKFDESVEAVSTKKTSRSERRPGQQLVEILYDAMQNCDVDFEGKPFDQGDSDMPQQTRVFDELKSKFAEWQSSPRWSREICSFVCNGHRFHKFDAKEQNAVRKDAKSFDGSGRLRQEWIAEAIAYYQNLFDEQSRVFEDFSDDKAAGKRKEELVDPWELLDKKRIDWDQQSTMTTITQPPSYEEQPVARLLPPARSSQRAGLGSLLRNSLYTLRRTSKPQTASSSQGQPSGPTPVSDTHHEPSETTLSAPPPYSSLEHQKPPRSALAEKGVGPLDAAISREVVPCALRRPMKRITRVMDGCEGATTLERRTWESDVDEEHPEFAPKQWRPDQVAKWGDLLVKTKQRYEITLVYDGSSTDQQINALLFEMVDAVWPGAAVDSWNIVDGRKAERHLVGLPPTSLGAAATTGGSSTASSSKASLVAKLFGQDKKGKGRDGAENQVLAPPPAGPQEMAQIVGRTLTLSQASSSR